MELDLIFSKLSEHIISFISSLMIASGACCHYISKQHGVTDQNWSANKWFWAGFFGTIPAVITLIGHVIILRLDSFDFEKKSE